MRKHDYPIIPTEWLKEVAKTRSAHDVSLLQTAIHLQEGKPAKLLEKGLGVADILLDLGLDTDALIVALLYPVLQAQEIDTDVILEKYGESCSKLLNDMLQMQSLDKLQRLQRNTHQMENLRKMLLAMVTDVRAVLIILSERLWQLRQAKHLPQLEQVKLAQETLDVYAPLANRLGVWQLKWETEDLCTRYLQPDIYSNIAKWLASRRQEREEYVKHIIAIITGMLEEASIKKFQVTGRVKHIYSIYKKMQRKNAELAEIYDISAVRVLVDNIDDCYTVLGLLQNTWPQIPEEFDDYIALPKPNGYRSIHMVIIGPENRNVEVQIRTYQMHHESELGVAAHWRYKEGVLQTSSYESKIALLRQIMAWQKEIVGQEKDAEKEKQLQDLFADRVYVFTPQGDIIDLQKGATPLDFAYQIHSEVGHRCRGAKIAGNIVPLTYQLQTGDRVEILTAKHANPSRDWVNPNYGYLKTAKARAKVLHWFRLKDAVQEVSHRVAVEKEPEPQPLPIIGKHTEPKQASSNVQIVGMNNLLSNSARCCKPLPGDPIVGYVTRTRGVSIHKRNCGNISHVAKANPARLIEVSWGEKHTGTYPVDLKLRIYDRAGLLRDITTVLAGDKINVQGLQTQKIHDSPEIDIYLTIEITSVQQLNKALALLKKIPNVIEVLRR